MKPLNGEFLVSDNNEKIRYSFLFQKIGNIKYVGHLDLLQIFRLVLRRADFPVVYTKGFNPHALVSIAVPLSVGIESYCEYMEVIALEKINVENYFKKINVMLPLGLRVLEIKEAPKSLTNEIDLALYQADFIYSSFDLVENTCKKMLDDEINVIKKTKRQEAKTNIRSLILELNAFRVSSDKAKTGIKALIKIGSKENLKISLLLETLFERLPSPPNVLDADITRLKLYANGSAL